MKKILLILILGLFACTSRQEMSGQQDEQQNGNNGVNFFKYISSLKVPEKLDFCGERVPLEISEVRERAEREFYTLLQQPGQVILYLKRSGRYFPMFEENLKKQNMPDDIKYLAVAESALYMARSAKDAVGIWQFIPSTAMKMGLIVNELVDERRHPKKSTIAALKYLKSGYNEHKSWFLAAAGYNMGHENVEKHLNYQSTNDIFELFMNEETSRYILRIVIIKEIMQNAEKYGFRLNPEDIYKPDQVKIVKTRAIENLSAWAKEQATTYKFVRLLNPWILQRNLPAMPGNQMYEIAVPEK